MIYVVGSINTDIVVYLDNFPGAGETVFGKQYIINQGGKGANQVVSSKKAGADPVFVGRIGNDFYGEYVKQELEKYNIKIKVKL